MYGKRTWCAYALAWQEMCAIGESIPAAIVVAVAVVAAVAAIKVRDA